MAYRLHIILVSAQRSDWFKTRYAMLFAGNDSLESIASESLTWSSTTAISTWMSDGIYSDFVQFMGDFSAYVTGLRWYSVSDANVLLATNSALTVGNTYTFAQCQTNANSELSGVTPSDPPTQATVYASSTGSPTGAGTALDPLDITSALNGLIRATSSIIVLDDCVVDADIYLQQAVTLRSNDSDWRTASIDFSIYQFTIAANCTIEHLELFSSAIDRIVDIGGIVTNDITKPNGPKEWAILGGSVTMRYCVLHDAYNFFKTSDSTLSMTECVLFNFGYFNINPEGRNHGHLLYLQNASGLLNLNRVLCGATLTGALRFFFSNQESQNVGLRVNKMLTISNPVLAGGMGRTDDIEIYEAHGWESSINVGYREDTVANGSALIADSYYYGGRLSAVNFEDLDIQNNVIIGNEIDSPKMITRLVDTLDAKSSWLIDNNDYHNDDPQRYWYSEIEAETTFVNWQGAGYDANGSSSSLNPSENVYFIWQFDAANPAEIAIIVFNWQSLNDVEIDVSIYLADGNYNVRNIYDYLNGHESVNVLDGMVTINMSERENAIPVGLDEPAQAIDIRFGVFVIEAA